MLNIELRVLSGKQKGKAIPLKTGKFLIGRGEDCHLRPSNDLVSRHHCVFTVDEYGLRVRDLGSTNGTFINGEQLRGQAVLKQDDKVSIGSLEFEVIIRETAEAATPKADTLEAGAIIESDTGHDASQLEDSSQTMVDVHVPGLDDTQHQPNMSDTQLGTTADTQVTNAPVPPGVPPMPQQMPAPLQYAPGIYPPQGYPYPPQPYGQPGYPPQPYGQPGYPPPPYGAYPQQPMMPPGYPPQPVMPQQMPASMPIPAEPVEEAREEEQKKEGPAVRLPDPSETGAKPPEPKSDSGSSGGSGGDAPVDPRQAANAILRQMQQRRPKSD